MKTHEPHEHQHGLHCSHTAIRHEEHVDYLHDGCLHHVRAGVVDEHVIAVNGTNPVDCAGAERKRTSDHVHGPHCGHEPVPHGNHPCYLVDGRLEGWHFDHYDDHGPIAEA